MKMPSRTPRTLLGPLAAAIGFLGACSGDAPDGATPRRSPPAAASEVVVNGQALSSVEVSSIEQVYGVTPRPGRYWYDPVSGLYGSEGQPAVGFMLPGHDLGRPDPDASAGDTGVWINGRQLPLAEWLVWSRTLGVPIQPGAYWLDGQGNAGNAGDPRPVVNLYAAAARGGGGGGGGGGDNFWSSRFSAGNYDQGGSRGYVSVPGYGPVGYGFD